MSHGIGFSNNPIRKTWELFESEAPSWLSQNIVLTETSCLRPFCSYSCSRSQLIRQPFSQTRECRDEICVPVQSPNKNEIL